MSNDIQKINTISGGQNAQNVHGNQIYIENQNNMSIHNQNNLSQNLKIDLIYNKEGVLLNTKELLINLLSLTINHNFYFEIICENYLNEEFYKDICLTLKKDVITELKSCNWNEKNINVFIKRIYKEESFHLFDLSQELSVENDFINILLAHLLKEKIENNKMPNLNDFNLALNFYKENDSFDFIKVFGYEFNQIFNLHELILKFELKYNSTLLNCHIKDVKNHNYILLDFFLNNNEKDAWEIQNLNKWLDENNIKSNLQKAPAKNIDELFVLAINNYFQDEDIKLWLKLQKYYLKYIKSPNATILELFLNNHESKDWTMNNLYYWLEKNNIKSDLIGTDAKYINELFDLVLGDGYFIEEDINFWNNLQNLYFFKI